MRGPDAARLLERALVASAAAEGASLAIDGNESRRWDSATFSGARHAVEASAPREGPVERWLAGLAGSELRLRGHVLADLAVTETARSSDRLRFRIEALTVER